MLTRRIFLAGIGATAAPVGSWAEANHPVALSAARRPDGRFALVGLRADGSLALDLDLPARGHAGAAHPTRAEALVLARRPGTYALVIDCISGAIRQRLTAPEGRHFYGHGAFTADGSLFLAPENDIETGEGRIGIWDAALGYQRIEDLPSGGIGPHEIIRLASGSFAIANGGIRTHPDKGREKLNLDTMRPNLTILSPSGRIIDQAEANAPQNSLRHIAEDARGRIITGSQWQGDLYDAPPLVGAYSDGVLRDLDDDPALPLRLDGYVGSVEKLGGGAAVTSPRGGVALVFDETGAATLSTPAPDVCGLASHAGDTLATDGNGNVHRLSQSGMDRIATHDLAFDNHIVSL